jgi:hypothetical protein
VRACVRACGAPICACQADLGTGGPLGPASMGREAAGRRRRLQGSGSGSRVERPLQGAVSRELREKERWDERCAASASGGKESVPPRGTGRRGAGSPGRGGPEKPWGAARAGKALRACLLGRFPTLPPRSRAGRLAGHCPPRCQERAARSDPPGRCSRAAGYVPGGPVGDAPPLRAGRRLAICWDRVGCRRSPSRRCGGGCARTGRRRIRALAGVGRCGWCRSS